MGKRAARHGSATTSPPLDGLAFLAGAVLVLVTPLVWDMGSADPFRGIQGTLSLAAWAVLATVFLARSPGRAALRDPWWWPWWGVLAGAALSAVPSGQPLRVLAAAAPLAVAATGWAALRQLAPRRRQRLLGLIILAGTIEAALTLLFLSPALQPASYHGAAFLAGRYRWVGTLGNPGDVAIFLVLPALLAASRAVGPGPRLTIFALPAGLMSAVVVASQSLSGVGALLLGAIVLSWRRVPRRRRLPAVAAVLLAAATLVALTPLRGRVAQAAGQLQQGRWIWLGSGRAAGYAAAAGMLAAHPLTGVGFALFEASSFRYQSEAVLAQRAHELGLVTAFGQTHNDLLQHAAETGLVGVALLALGIWVAVRRRPSSSGALPWAPLLAGAGVIALLQFPLHIPAIAAQWAVLWALAVAPLPAPPTHGDTSRRVRQVVTLAATAAVVWLGWQHHRAEVALQQGKVLVQTLQTAPSERARTTLARMAGESLARRRFWLPYSWDLEVTLGNLAMLGNHPPSALDHFRAALSLAERPEIRFDIGMALMAGGNRAAGLDELERAVRLNPAILQQISNEQVAAALRSRLDADGFSRRHPWIYDPAAQPTR